MPLLANPPQPPQLTLSESVVDLVPAETGSVAEIGRPALRMTLPPRVTSSNWFKPVFMRLRSVSALTPGWDSYGGLPTSYSTVAKTLTFLGSVLEPLSAPPTVVPLSDGGVQLVWNRNGLSIEVTVASDDEEFYVRDAAGGTEAAYQDIYAADARDAFRDVLLRLRG